MRIRSLCLSVLLCGSLAQSAFASTINFSCITSNDPSGSSCGIAESQISVALTDVTDTSGGKALFTFQNIGSDVEAFIGAIYVYDSQYLGSATLDNSDTGVQFSEGARPAKLPAYKVAASFSADNDPGAFNGIHAGESLGITFALAQSFSYQDIISALLSDDITMGVHVQGLGAGSYNEYSESLVSAVPVPVPAAVWLFISGIIGLVATAKIRKS